MGRYPAQPLEEKLAWMRERQKAKADREQAQPMPLRVVKPAEPVYAPPRMLRVKQVADILQVSERTVKRQFRRRAVFVKGPQRSMMLIPQRALDEWVRENMAR